jgi:hypothetical protein
LFHIVVGFYHLLRSVDRCFNSERRDSLHDVSGDGMIHTHSADADALACADMGIIPATLIAVRVARSHAIEDVHHTATAPATYKASQ